MIISGTNLELRYYNKSKSCFELYKEIENSQIGYEIIPGQRVYKITYDGMSSNQLIRYNCLIKEIDDRGILFIDQGKEVFYQWELNYKNYLKKIDKMKLVIGPCESLFEKYPIKNLLAGKIENYVYSGFNDVWHNKIWYSHGGWITYSGYEKNLKHFKILGQQSLV